MVSCTACPPTWLCLPYMASLPLTAHLPTTACFTCRDVECLEQQGLEPRAVGTLLLDAFAQMTCE